MVAVTPREAVLGAGAGGPLSVPPLWTQFPGYISFTTGGVVVGNPSGLNKGVGTFNAQAIYINGVLVDFSKYLPFTGGILTGLLTLAVDPVNPFDAVTKRYADNQVITINGNFANYLPLTGGTLTGSLTLSADPTTSHQAATKQYVDSVGTGFTIPDAPSDGTNYGRRNGVWADTSVIDVGTF